MKFAHPCPECASDELYETTKDVWSGSGTAHFDDVLPGLGGLFSTAKLSVLVCADCGLTRLFASHDACAQLSRSPNWARVKVGSHED